MDNVINLRQARKAQARAAKARQAETNRALHGRSRAERDRDADTERRMQAVLDGARRDSDPTDQD